MPNGTQQMLAGAAKALRADPRKTGLMSALGLVLLIMVVRMLACGARPSGAMASLLLSNRSVPTTGKPLSNARSSQAFAQWRNLPLQNIGRNLFATRLEYFPVDNSKSAVGGVDGDFWSALGKSITQATDEETKRENVKESFRQQAGKLRLESTMAGPQPRAILNGKLVSEGSVVENFRVERIEARRLILEREGLRFELGMK